MSERETRFTVTLTYSYTKTDAELSQYYDTLDLDEAARIDQSNFLAEPEFILEDITQNGRPYHVDVSTEVIE